MRLGNSLQGSGPPIKNSITCISSENREKTRRAPQPGLVYSLVPFPSFALSFGRIHNDVPLTGIERRRKRFTSDHSPLDSRPSTVWSDNRVLP